MKKALFSAALAAAIAAGAITTTAVADDAKSDRVVKSSHVKKSKQDRPAVKDTASQTDYYIRARETQMKISM
ncbi:MAG TPA: hypothetical protein VFC45_10145 [Pseudolabrys sp.]|nr:hypothetical protein [Pseudolabrys sp.]